MPPKKTKSAVIEKRRRAVAANLLAGLNYRDIAEGLNVSVGTVSGDVKALMTQWREDQAKDVGDHVAIDLRRMDMAINAIWDDVKAGKLQAIDRLLKILERRSKMLGYDKPDKVDIVDWRQEAEQAGINADEAYRQAVAVFVAHFADGLESDDDGGDGGGETGSETSA